MGRWFLQRVLLRADGCQTRVQPKMLKLEPIERSFRMSKATWRKLLGASCQLHDHAHAWECAASFDGFNRESPPINTLQ